MLGVGKVLGLIWEASSTHMELAEAVGAEGGGHLSHRPHLTARRNRVAAGMGILCQ